MHVGWTFLDTADAAVKALTAYEGMKNIIENTPEEMIEVERQMTSLRSPVYSGLPHSPNPKSGESRLLSGIDRLDLLKARYQQAQEYMDWFRPAWNGLKEDDRYVLKMFFVNAKEPDAVGAVAEHFGVERTSAYTKRKRAIKRLAMLLYGRE